MLGNKANLRRIVVRAVLAVVVFAAWAANADFPPTQFNEFTVAQLQALMASERLTSRQLTEYYIDRINALDQPNAGQGPGVNSVIELNPDALAMADTPEADPAGWQGTAARPRARSLVGGRLTRW